MNDEEIHIQRIEPYVPNWRDGEIRLGSNGILYFKEMTRAEVEERFGKDALPQRAAGEML